MHNFSEKIVYEWKHGRIGWAHLILLRPLNMLLVFATVLVGAALCRALDWRALLAGISAALILAAGNAVNDYFDAAADAVAHPERPIPSGKVSRNMALMMSATLFAAGLIIAAVLSWNHLIMAAIVVVLLIAYSAKLSGLPLLGNIIISAASALAVIYGALSAGICEKSIWAAVIAAAIHLPREIFKDIQDISGDIAAGRSTLPRILGRRRTACLGSSLAIAAIAMIASPRIHGAFSVHYGFVALVPAALCAVAAVLGFIGSAKIAQTLLKIAMAAGIIALWAEVLFGS